MSREIKFRIMFKKDPNIWVKDEYTLRELTEMDSFGFLGDDDIIEQSTGLKDKNGKEIYGGDIVKVDGQRYVMRAFVRPALIESGFALFDSQIRQIKLQERSADTAEVIGNIHENPELLGGEE